mmetsp:Transcript_16481/g.36431  ORF Transcript_16481/g.36431 Transcript_16481/m.36431 type:complete len:203 (-) Transcript_16481:811-1419(-)
MLTRDSQTCRPVKKRCRILPCSTKSLSSLVGHIPVRCREGTCLHGGIEAELARQHDTCANFCELVGTGCTHDGAGSLERWQRGATANAGDNDGIQSNAGIQILVEETCGASRWIYQVKVGYCCLRLCSAGGIISCGNVEGCQTIGRMGCAADSAHELVRSAVHLLKALQPVWRGAQNRLAYFLGNDAISNQGVPLSQKRVHH